MTPPRRSVDDGVAAVRSPLPNHDPQSRFPQAYPFHGALRQHGLGI